MKRIALAFLAAILALGVWRGVTAQTVIDINIRVDEHIWKQGDGVYVILRVVINAITGEIITYSYETVQLRRRVLL